MNDKLFEQIGKLIENLTNLLRKEVQESKEELKVAIDKSKEELKVAIDKSQEDTIDAVTDLMNSGYESHEERIKRIEDQLKTLHLQ